MIKDFVAEGIESGWKHHDASLLNEDLTLQADVAIVGTGAGGGTAAEILSNAGLKLVMVEEGPLKTVRDFKMLESDAYPQLYQESASRKTKDKGIDIYQGRCVGGGTTVNWTTSFRTPPKTLEHWTDVYGLKGFTEKEMAPWFKVMERRLNIKEWELPPNENNDVMRRGLEKLGIPYGVIPRNVRECRDLGYCGMGCPVGAKQDMLTTTIPAALQNGAVLVSRARAERLVFKNGKIDRLECIAMDRRGNRPTRRRVNVKADYYILSAGAIGSPALLMRSKLPDPQKLVGKRTFLHPVSASGAFMPEPVEAFSGAPQSIYSDHFLYPADGSMGYWLEVPPVHPIMAGTKLRGHGKRHSGLMNKFPYMQVIIALTRDGFHDESVGGAVELKKDGTPVLDYPITDYVWDGILHTKLTCAEIQFAAGANLVGPFHEESPRYTSWAEAKREIPRLKLEIMRMWVTTAHQMGGCAMGESARSSVVDSNGRHRHAENLYVFDGSTFPTSVATNPQLTIFAMVAKQATRLAGQITG
jgi:choline dehydrogenase-like flavoprotein